MGRKYKIKNKKLIIQFVILGCIILSTCCLSIGYAELNTLTLRLDGKVSAKPINELIITQIQYDTSNEADIMNSVVHQYSGTNMESTISLTDNANSSITYNITMYNGDTQVYLYKEVEYIDECYDNSDIVFEINGLKPGDTINKYETITFSITFHYLNGVVPENKVLKSYLKFKFEKATEMGDDGIIINTAQVDIYDASIHKIPLDIKNNNEHDVSLKFKFDNNVLAETLLEPLQTKSLEVSIQDFLHQIDLNKEYTISVERTDIESNEKQTEIKFLVYPTITNYVLGCKDAGTEVNPYLIYKIEDLVRLAQKVNTGMTFLNKYIKIKNNIDFKVSSDYYNNRDTSFGNLNANSSDGNEILTEMTTGTGFMGIGRNETNSFQGIFLGNGKIISNIYINNTINDLRMSLFTCVKNARIQDLTITGEYTVGGDSAGLVGTLYGINTITNCHNRVTITNKNAGFCVAGLLSTLENGTETIVTGCSNLADITNVSATGGLVGLILDSVKLNISNCYNTGNIISTETSTSGGKYTWTATGGLVAKDSKTKTEIIIFKSYNTGMISGMKDVGSLIGFSKGKCTITSCYNIGTVTGKSENIGGIIGEKNTFSADIQKSYNAGTVSGGTYVGAIIGHVDQVICNIATAYFLNNIDSAIGNEAETLAGSRTDEFMKTDDFVTLLGDDFQKDTTIINKGYPILKKPIIS